MGSTVPRSILDDVEAHVPPNSFPVAVELVPGALHASVHVHRIHAQSGPITCWSYMTSGLSAWRQKEVVFTVAADSNADVGRFPTDPLRFASTIFQLAAQGRIVEAGGVSEVGGAGFMGRRGITYAAAQPLDGVPITSQTLAAISITAEELEVLRVGGQSRVLSALGHAYRHYPFPPWIDRRRGSVITPQTTQGTILGQVPHLAASGFVRMDTNTIRLRLRPEASARIGGALATLPANAGFALTTEIDPTSDGCLVWKSGQKEPAAITPPGSQGQRLAGCFALFVPEQPDDGGQMFEDGYAVLLTNHSTAALRNALSSGHPLAIRGSREKMGFSLEWIPPSH